MFYGILRTVHAAKIKHKRIRSTASIPQNRLWTVEVSLDGMSALGRAYVFFVLNEVDDGGVVGDSMTKMVVAPMSVLQRTVITQKCSTIVGLLRNPS